MKKILLIFSAIMGVCFAATGAMAYGIDNLTEVQWSDNPAKWTSAKTASIGAPLFNTFGADWDPTSKTLTIYSNWSPVSDGHLSVTTADLFIDADGLPGWDYAIGLDSVQPNGKGLDRAGNIYTGAIKYSTDFAIGFAIGTQARTLPTFPAAPIPVFMTTRDITNNATVAWTALGADPGYKVDVTYANLPDVFLFMWASGTCGNGPIQGVAPLPGTLLLLGSGLTGLAAYARRRQK